MALAEMSVVRYCACGRHDMRYYCRKTNSSDPVNRTKRCRALPSSYINQDVSDKYKPLLAFYTPDIRDAYQKI